MMSISNTAAQLLDFWELVKEIAAAEGISLDEASVEAALIWEHIHPPLPRVEITPTWGGRTGETKAA